GGELLLRWHHPEHGPVAPARFIPVAEESGLICEIGAWVIEQACETLLRLAQAGAPLCLSVNIQPRQFHPSDFGGVVRDMLARTRLGRRGAEGSRLILGVTEGLFLEHWESAASRMAELTALGIRFSIDAFGPGYSSLAYLRRLPLHELKIDRSFVQDVPRDPN